MADRYLVLSDLHLTELEEHADGWLAYKSVQYTFDEELAAVLRKASADAMSSSGSRSSDSGAQGSAAGDRLVCIFNGDVFDFDLVWCLPDEPPWPVTRKERKRGLVANETKSVWKVERILSFHPRFVDALVDLAAAGQEIVFTKGNHDMELHFDGVRDAIERALISRAAERGVAIAEHPIRFEDWFYYEPGKIYAEHGQQYDYYSSVPWMLAPTYESDGDRLLYVPMGNLSNRYLMSHIGFFNPHASDFILNAFRYAAHWLKHYAFSRRSLIGSWLWGSIVTMWDLLRIRRQAHKRPEDYDERLDAVAERFHLPRETVDALEGLRRPPITQRFFRIVREFWIDRVVIAALMTGGTIALALVPIPLWIKLMVPLSSFPLVFLLYEHVAHGETIFSMESRLPSYARQIEKLLPVRVVTFGHTHCPRLIPLDRTTTFVDSGTWAPIWDPKRKSRLLPGYRNVLHVRIEGDEVAISYCSQMGVDGVETDHSSTRTS